MPNKQLIIICLQYVNSSKVLFSRHKVIKHKKECLMTNYSRIDFLSVCEDMFALWKFTLFNSVKIIVINEG